MSVFELPMTTMGLRMVEIFVLETEDLYQYKEKTNEPGQPLFVWK
jgi:hypothetical protein